MSEDLEKALSGAFFAPMIRCRGLDSGPGFCKPDRIVVYSAPPPVRMRVVCYRMLIWPGSDQPSAESLLNQGQRYRSGHSDQVTFSFTTGTVPTDVNGFLTEIRRHFGAIELQGKQSRDCDNGFGRMMAQNDAQLSHRLSNGMTLMVNEIHHRLRIPTDELGQHIEGDQHLRFRGYIDWGKETPQIEYKDGQYVAVRQPYEDNRLLANQAIDWWTNYRLRHKVIQQFAR